MSRALLRDGRLYIADEGRGQRTLRISSLNCCTSCCAVTEIVMPVATMIAALKTRERFEAEKIARRRKQK